jgi:hypothetical protein
MVEGTFAKIKRGLSVHYNVVSASRVICRQGSPGDEPEGGRDPVGGVGGGDDRAREFEHRPALSQPGMAQILVVTARENPR